MKNYIIICLVLAILSMSSCSKSDSVKPETKVPTTFFSSLYDSLETDNYIVFSSESQMGKDPVFHFENNIINFSNQQVGDIGTINIGSVNVNYREIINGIFGYDDYWTKSDASYSQLKTYFSDSLSVTNAHPEYGFTFNGKATNISKVDFGSPKLFDPISKSTGKTITWDNDNPSNGTFACIYLFADDDAADTINPTANNHPGLKLNIADNGTYNITSSNLSSFQVGMKLRVWVIRGKIIPSVLANSEPAVLITYHLDKGYYTVVQ